MAETEMFPVVVGLITSCHYDFTPLMHKMMADVWMKSLVPFKIR